MHMRCTLHILYIIYINILEASLVCTTCSRAQTDLSTQINRSGHENSTTPSRLETGNILEIYILEGPLPYLVW